MTLELNPQTAKWILSAMEALTKSIMLDSDVWKPETIVRKIGEFSALKQLLDNSGFESYGIKFKVEIPTVEEYAQTASQGLSKP